MQEVTVREKEVIFRYYITYLSVTSGTMASLIVDLDDIISEPEDIEETKSRMAKELKRDPDSLMIVAFSYMGLREELSEEEEE